MSTRAPRPESLSKVELRELGRLHVNAWLEVRNVKSLNHDDTADLMERLGAAIEAERTVSRALCATVKQLRKQLVVSEDWRGTAMRERDEAERLLDAVRKRADINYAALTDLQSQLEQLRAENERLRKEVKDLTAERDAARELHERQWS